MDNNFFQDIKPLTKQDEAVPMATNNTSVPGMQTMREVELAQALGKNPHLFDDAPKQKTAIWVVAIICLVILGGVLSFFFAQAVVKITPKQLSVPIQDSFVFSKTGTAGFEVMEIEDSVSEEVLGTKKVTKTEKAIGQVTLYNTQSNPQTLVATTRLESPDGKIFRISSKVIIPKGTDEKPGEVSVSVVADKIGPEYNVGPAKFTVPGLKNSPSYNKVYAQSKETFSGGINGETLSLSDEDIATKEALLLKNLSAKLKDQIIRKVPEGYVYISGADSMTSAPLEVLEGTSPENALVSKKGKISAILIQKDILDAKLKEKIILEKETPVLISGTESLTAVVTSPQTLSPEASETTLSITGDLQFTWSVNTDTLKQSLLGQNKKMFNGFMAEYADVVDRAELIIKPFWVKKIPTKESRVKIILN